MKLIGNLIWVLFGGLLLAIEYAILGLIWCITIIGIPLEFSFSNVHHLPYGPSVEKCAISNSHLDALALE